MGWRRAVGKLALTLTCAVVTAQGQQVESGERTWRFGGEVDAVSYATKGFYGSFFAGKSRWRVRGVVSRVNPPGFYVPYGFDDLRVDAYVVAVDRFFGKKGTNMEGFWIGPGIELWRSRVSRDGVGGSVRFNNLVPTIGAGYVWKLSPHVYLNPWGAGHIVAAGDRSIDVSGLIYEQRVFTPEASLKIGFVF